MKLTPVMSLDTSENRSMNAGNASSAEREYAVTETNSDTNNPPGSKGEAVSTGETAVPTWFQKRRTKSDPEQVKPAGPPVRPGQKRSAQPLPRILVFPADEVELDWPQKLKRWVLSFGTTAYLISFLFHFLVLLALSIAFVRSMAGDGTFTTLLSQGDDQQMQFDTLIDSQLDAGAEAEQVPAFTMVPVESLQFTEPAVPEISEAFTPSTGKADDGDDAGAGLAFKMPESGKAVTQGSFTVWTVPEDPLPRQNYLIIIQIKLPDKVRRYPTSDLLGSVVGTDSYRQPIPGDTRRMLPVKNNTAQFTVLVPGADALVEDTIQIRSVKILKEKQTLKIRF
jgi:hypothetical protein